MTMAFQSNSQKPIDRKYLKPCIKKDYFKYTQQQNAISLGEKTHILNFN